MLGGTAEENLQVKKYHQALISSVFEVVLLVSMGTSNGESAMQARFMGEALPWWYKVHSH